MKILNTTSYFAVNDQYFATTDSFADQIPSCQIPTDENPSTSNKNNSVEASEFDSTVENSNSLKMFVKIPLSPDSNAAMNGIPKKLATKLRKSVSFVHLFTFGNSDGCLKTAFWTFDM